MGGAEINSHTIKQDQPLSNSSVVIGGTKQEVVNSFVSSHPDREKLIELVNNKPGIRLKMKDANIMEVTVEKLWKADHVIDGLNQSFRHLTAFGLKLYEMIKGGETISIDLQTFVGTEYIKGSFEQYPHADIGERIMDACEARAHFPAQRILQPSHDKPPLDRGIVSVKKGTFVSDKQSLIYTVKFGSAE